MWTAKYLAAVIAITLITLFSGAMQWLSETEQVLNPFEGWERGNPDAPVTLHLFTDFT